MVDSSALNGIGGSSPQLLEHDANNSDTLLASSSQPGNSVSLDAASTGSSPLSAAANAHRRQHRRSVNVRLLSFIV